MEASQNWMVEDGVAGHHQEVSAGPWAILINCALLLTAETSAGALAAEPGFHLARLPILGSNFRFLCCCNKML